MEMAVSHHETQNVPRVAMGNLLRDVLYVDGQIYNEPITQTPGKRNQYNNCTITPTTQAQLGHTRRWH